MSGTRLSELWLEAVRRDPQLDEGAIRVAEVLARYMNDDGVIEINDDAKMNREQRRAAARRRRRLGR